MRSLHRPTRKQLGEALKKSEEKFAKAFRESPLALMLTSAKDDRYIEVNETFERITGWKHDEVIGRTPYDIGIWVDPNQRADFVRRLLSGGTVRNLDFRFRTRHGEVRAALGSAELIEIDGERCVLAVAADTTDLKKADEVRLRHAAIVESSDDAIIAKNLEGIISAWNPAAQRLFGFTEQEAIGQPITIIVPPELHDEENDILRRLRAGERLEHYETQRVSKDEKKIDVSITVSPVRDAQGRIIGASTIARDITESKRVEKALRKSEERFRLAAQAGKMFACEWDAATDVIERSEGTATILGVNEGPHTTGQHVLAIIPREDRETLIASMAQLTPEQPNLRISYRMIRSDGTLIWVDTTSRAYFNEHGRILRIVGMLVDVTDRVRAEEALAGVSRQLIEAQEQERKRIARELHDNTNQRLALLAVGIDKLKNDLPHQLGDVRVRVDEIHRQTLEISKDVQALSHELHSSKLEYLGLVSAMKSFCKEFGGKLKVEVVFASEGMPPAVPQEISICLFRVMQEGLQNALKHSGVRFFEVKLHGSPTDIQLTVRDSGVGFDPELMKDNPGLGLISMQERVRLVKGTISITSRPQSGTEINVRVPLSAGAQTERTKLAGA